MAKDLNHLIEVRDNLQQQLKLLDLRREALQKKVDASVQAVQATCTHEDVEETSSYHGGGYDYCAETFYSQTCRTCGKVLKQWSKTHHGVYG